MTTHKQDDKGESKEDAPANPSAAFSLPWEDHASSGVPSVKVTGSPVLGVLLGAHGILALTPAATPWCVAGGAGLDAIAAISKADADALQSAVQKWVDHATETMQTIAEHQLIEMNSELFFQAFDL